MERLLYRVSNLRLDTTGLAPVINDVILLRWGGIDLCVCVCVMHVCKTASTAILLAGVMFPSNSTLQADEDKLSLV